MPFNPIQTGAGADPPVVVMEVAAAPAEAMAEVMEAVMEVKAVVLGLTMNPFPALMVAEADPCPVVAEEGAGAEEVFLYVPSLPFVLSA